MTKDEQACKHNTDDPFKHIMSTKEASQLWGLTQDSVKRLAREKKIIAKKLDPNDPKSPYMVFREQPNPSHKNRK